MCLSLEFKAHAECTFSSSNCINTCPVGFESDAYGCPVSCICAISGVFESDVAFNPNTLSALLEVSHVAKNTSFFLLISSNDRFQEQL